MTDGIDDLPKRKTMFLSSAARRDLATTSARRHTEREAVEEALTLLVERDAQLDAMDEFVEWARTEWGEPSVEEKRRAEEIWHGKR